MLGREVIASPPAVAESASARAPRSPGRRPTTCSCETSLSEPWAARRTSLHCGRLTLAGSTAEHQARLARDITAPMVTVDGLAKKE